jgi:hypothetical protein
LRSAVLHEGVEKSFFRIKNVRGFDLTEPKIDNQEVFFVPLDKFFSSEYKRRGRSASGTMAARHRMGWPAEAKFGPATKMEMRLAGTKDEWYHVINVPASVARVEIEAWREANPEHEFRYPDGIPALKEKKMEKKPVIETLKVPGRRKKWDQEGWREREARLPR